MKKIFRNNRLIAVAFLTLFTGAAAMAHPYATTNPVVPVELKFAGMVKNNPVFELVIGDSQVEDLYTVTIADTYGNVLYSERFKTETLSKKFLLKTEELDGEKLFFKVSSRNNNKTAVFEIQSSSKLVSETTVNLIQ